MYFFEKCSIIWITFCANLCLRRSFCAVSSLFYVFILINYLQGCSSLILLSGDIKTDPGPNPSSGQCFSICHWNVNSITAYNFAKLSLLTAYNLVHRFDIICLSEAYLNSETPPNDVWNCQVIICSVLITLPTIKEEVFVFTRNRPFL